MTGPRQGTSRPLQDHKESKSFVPSPWYNAIASPYSLPSSSPSREAFSLGMVTSNIFLARTIFLKPNTTCYHASPLGEEDAR